MSKKQIRSPGPMGQVDLVQSFLRFLNPFEVIALTRVSKLFQRVTHKPSTFSSSLVYIVSHDHNSGHLYCSKSGWGRKLLRRRKRTKKPNISFDSIVQTPRTNDLIKGVFIGGMNGHIRRINTDIRFPFRKVQNVDVTSSFDDFPMESIREYVEVLRISHVYISSTKPLGIESMRFPKLECIFIHYCGDPTNLLNMLPPQDYMPKLTGFRINQKHMAWDITKLNDYPGVTMLRVDVRYPPKLSRLNFSQTLIHIETLILYPVHKEWGSDVSPLVEIDWNSAFPNLKKVIKKGRIEVIPPSHVLIECF